MPRAHHPGSTGPDPYPAEPAEGPGLSKPEAPRRPAKGAIAAALVALATGAWLIHDGSQTNNPPAPNSADALTSAAPPNPPKPPPRPPVPDSLPHPLRIPSPDVSAPPPPPG